MINTLDARYYTQPEVYKLEQDGLLAETWQFACHQAQIPNVGDYHCFTIAGQNLFVIRQKDGGVGAFYNVCQHRAHELLEGSGNSKVLVCPYHAWTYNMDGGLRGGPNLDKVQGLDKSKICLTKVAVEDFHGFLFVNLNPDAPAMDQWFPNAREELKSFVPHIEELQPILWIDTPEDCNWKISVENYSECYHCARCHPTFASGVVKPSTYDIRPQGYCLRHTTECQNLDQMTYPIELDSNEHAGDYSSWFLWPMFSFQVYPGNILNTYHWREVGHDHVVVWRGWYTIGGEDSDVIRGLAKQDRETTVEEDLHLVESVQRGLNNRGFQPGPLVLDPDYGVNSEHSVEALQRWARQAIDDKQTFITGESRG